MKGYSAVHKTQQRLAVGIFRDSAIVTGAFILIIILLV